MDYLYKLKKLQKKWKINESAFTEYTKEETYSGI